MLTDCLFMLYSWLKQHIYIYTTKNILYTHPQTKFGGYRNNIVVSSVPPSVRPSVCLFNRVRSITFLLRNIVSYFVQSLLKNKKGVSWFRSNVIFASSRSVEGKEKIVLVILWRNSWSSYCKKWLCLIYGASCFWSKVI